MLAHTYLLSILPVRRTLVVYQVYTYTVNIPEKQDRIPNAQYFVESPANVFTASVTYTHTHTHMILYPSTNVLNLYLPIRVKHKPGNRSIQPSVENTNETR